jgi:Cu/Ag efflux protein CusF
MRLATLVTIAIAAAAAPLAHAQKPEGMGAVTTSPGKGQAVAMVKASATVEKVDAAARSVTLKMPQGDSRTFQVGPEVRNFEQIKVGDKLNVAYMESLTVELLKDGKAIVGRTETVDAKRAAPGAKPGGGARREITAVADVVAVDAAAQKVSVKNRQGEIIDLRVRDPEQLKLVKKGDQIQATFTEAVAVSMEPAAPAAPAKKK